MEYKDYYKALGVERGASDDEIRKFLYYFEHSTIMRHHIMLQFKTMLIKDRELIETEIGEYNESKNEDQNPGIKSK